MQPLECPCCYEAKHLPVISSPSILKASVVTVLFITLSCSVLQQDWFSLADNRTTGEHERGDACEHSLHHASPGDTIADEEDVPASILLLALLSRIADL